MALICAGDVPVKQIRMAAEKVQRHQSDMRVYFPMEKNSILEKYREKEMGLSCPSFQIGFKFQPVPKEKWLQTRIAMGFLLEILAGESSSFFQQAYERNLLDEPMGEAFFCFSVTFSFYGAFGFYL